jgi:hypothetical protein
VNRSVFSKKDTNFIAVHSIGGLHVFKGDHNRDTCFWYVTKDEGGMKLLTIKYYDKVMGRIVKDDTLFEGSRVTEIVGSKNNLKLFNTRERQA